MNTPQSQDKRQFTRITFDSPVYLSTESATWQSELVDISLNGVLIDKPTNWQNLMLPLEILEDRLGKVWSPVSHLNSVCNNESLRKA